MIKRLEFDNFLHMFSYHYENNIPYIIHVHNRHARSKHDLEHTIYLIGEENYFDFGEMEYNKTEWFEYLSIEDKREMIWDIHD